MLFRSLILAGSVLATRSGQPPAGPEAGEAALDQPRAAPGPLSKAP